MEENSHASVARKVDTTNQDNKYRTLVEKLIQLEVNDQPSVVLSVAPETLTKV